MLIDILLCILLIFLFFNHSEEAHESDDNNYNLDKNDLTVTDRETGHILLVRHRFGVISSYGILPEQRLTVPLKSWRLGENPFPNNKLYSDTYEGIDGQQHRLVIRTDVDFNTLLDRYESEIKKAS